MNDGDRNLISTQHFAKEVRVSDENNRRKNIFFKMLPGVLKMSPGEMLPILCFRTHFKPAGSILSKNTSYRKSLGKAMIPNH